MSAPVNKGPFEEALDQFRASLAPQEQSIFTPCSSPEELIRHVENLDSIKKIQKRGAFMRRVKIFSDSLRHYFDVIGILVQSHPEYAALAWGAFRLVLQLASNFGEFFDKLTNTLLRLAEVLPWYEELASSLMGTRKNFSWPYQASSRLVASLTNIYVDLFVFLQSVVRVFTKKDTSNRSSVVIFSSLFWKPYDARFQDVLDSMKHHQKLLTTELSLYGHQTTHVNLAKETEDLKKELQGIRGVSKKQQDRCEEIRRRLGDLAAMIANSTRNSRTLEISLSKIGNNIAAQIEKFKKEIDSKLRTQMKASLEDRIHRWLSAPAYANDLVKARKERENGTSEWFFHEHRFQQWLRVGTDDLDRLVSNRFGNNTLWVQGNPGFGKTIIAGAVIDELEWRVPTASPIFYFFFRQEPTLDNSTAAYRSLLTQILNKCKRDEIFDKFAFGIGYSPSGQPTGTQTELFELTQLCAELIGPHYIVLDGIDECSDKNELIVDLTKLGPNSKLILFSRPNVRFLREKTTQDQQIDIGRSNTDDIQMFLERRLTELAQRDMLLEGANIQKYTLHLTDGADGMFLWAKLMTDYLESDAWSDQDRHDTIVAIAMPERLSVMYLRIIKLICLGLSHEKKMAKWIIMWLTFSLRPLTASELEESVKLLNENSQAKPGRRDFAKAVVMICACLVEKATLYDDYGKEQVYFRFIHSTVKGYFVNLFTEAGMSELPGDIRSDVASIATSTPHMEICRSCLQYMLFHMPAQSLGEALKNSVESQITVDDLEIAFPFSGYVTVLWTNHLRRTKDELFARSGPDCVNSDSTRNLFDVLAQFLAKNPVVRVWIEVTYTMGLNHDRSVDALRAWSDDVKAKRAKFGDFNAKITSVLSTVDALIHYLPELDKYWGSPLKDCPGRIWAWDEVHAFTPSQFSDKSSATVHSLFAGDPQQAGITLSKRYLCKISESTPKFVGTLSVWSSLAFESLHDGKPQFSHFLKDESVTGWMARYEVWTIDGSPKRLLIKDIFLEASEVRLQLLQSLRVDTGVSVPRWKVQFPVTVGSDLQRLTILRTVYWLEPLKGKSEGRLRSALLDLSLEPYSTAKWNELCYDRDQASRQNSIALYTYWIRFSKAGDYIFFMDRNNTAVFSLRPDENKGPMLTAFAGGQNFGDKDNEPLRQLDVQFHPQKPLVAYRTGRKVFLWVFKNSYSQPKLCYETPSGHLSFPEHITFTSNSEQLVIKEHNCELPIVMSLPMDILNALENENVVYMEEDEDEERQSGSVLAERPTLDLWSFKSASLELVSGAYVQTQSSGESLGFTPFHSRNDAGVTLWQNTTNGFQQQRFEIVKFPAWEGISTVSTSVKLPEPGHSDVTLVLNKAVQSDNFFGEAQPEHFPALIRREVTSLRPLSAEGTEAKSHGKRLQKSAEEQRKKRPRFASIGGYPSTDGSTSVEELNLMDGSANI